MKFKFVPMLAGAIAAIAIAATPLVAAAETQGSGSEESTPRIVLSEEQQAQFEEIQNEATTALEAVLSPEQKAQLADGVQSGQGLGAVQNLSDTQLTEIQRILQQFNNRIGEMLTQEQKQQIEESMQNQQ